MSTMKHEEAYSRVLDKRHSLIARGELSAPNVAGSDVALLVAYMPEFTQDDRDSEENFAEQTDRVKRMYQQLGREATVFMRATVADFKDVLEDKRFATVVPMGFGHMAAISVPLDRDRQSVKYTYLDWLHLADIATHLKTGDFHMLQCTRPARNFNAPLGVGVALSHRNILGEPAGGRYATSEIPTTPVTDKDELSLDDITEHFNKNEFNTEASKDYQTPLGRAAQAIVDLGLLSHEKREQLRGAYKHRILGEEKREGTGERVLLPPPSRSRFMQYSIEVSE